MQDKTPTAPISSDATLLLNLIRAQGETTVRVRSWTAPLARELEAAGLATIRTAPGLLLVSPTT